MLAGELPRQGAQVAHALDGNEEGLVGRESRFVQLGDLVAEVPFELIDVGTFYGRRRRYVSPPLRDLRLELLHAQALPST